MTTNLEEKNIEVLIKRCREEEARFRTHGCPSAQDTHGACRELFRRAIVAHTQPAWRAVYAQYHAQMIRWASDNQANAEDIVQEAWEKFINAVTPERFPGFPHIGALLSFLKRCVKSVHIDQERAREREQVALEAWANLGEAVNQNTHNHPPV
jgi:DNA-directed RNA polymerase specialized sigma24 family protein